MRISRFVTILAASVVAFGASVLPAQIISSVGGVGFGGGGVVGAPRKPYTSTSTTKSVQTLANGTTITRESTDKVAIDSAGRIYTEQHHAIPAGADGQPREQVFYVVNDPAARTTLFWNSESKEATLNHHEPPQSQTQRPAPEVHNNLAQPAAQSLVAHRANTEVQHEDLGTKTIAGVTAIGTRTTRTIPAGREGNDQPLTVTTETWRSPEYGVILLNVTDDPRNGKSTREVTEFIPGEPAPELFQAPEGYTVKDVTLTPHRAEAVE